MKLFFAALMTLSGLMTGCSTIVCALPPRPVAAWGPHAELHQTLNDWHDAAARGDADAYFSRMTDDAVFLGTDAGERWTRAEFMAYAEPYFGREDRGAWSYIPVSREITVAEDGDTAWFDELLSTPKYGTARGVGVLRRGEDGVYRVALYGLSFPIPNELADEMTRRIQRFEERGR